MSKAYKNAKVYKDGSLAILNAKVCDGKLEFSDEFEPGDEIYENCLILPGLADVHVHLREPGFSYKETIATGTAAAARGGYTAVCSMPNLNPVPDSTEHLNEQLDIIRKDAVIRVCPYGAITCGEKGEELSDMEGMAPYVCGFSDDGRGVQKDNMMHSAMIKARQLGKPIAAHCEVNELLKGGYIHEGRYAAEHGHKGICSASEYEQIARDIELVKETGCAYHVCHISTKESVDIIRKAKAAGVNITCETGPHYLLMCEDDLQENGRFKMNPPLRSEEDKKALLEGITDGTIDMIATDHAPHSAEEKGKGLAGSAMGVVGIETAFPLLYTYLVKEGRISLERLLQMMVDAPKERFGIDTADDFTVFDLSDRYTIDPADFLSKGRATPFEGWEVNGRCLLTVCDGRIAYEYRK
ncbi:MAG: dihydroorotase [Parasporobacterium sp.]|nr:dihydroorotase [Parasporobacterium sp.]